MNDLLEYAVSSYAFVLPRNGIFSFKFWAKEISTVYDGSNLQNAAVMSEIKKLNGKIIRRNGVNTIELD